MSATVEGMEPTYAVTWQETGGTGGSGKLELGERGMRIEGKNGSSLSSLLVPYDELLGIQLAPITERLGGRPTLVLERPRRRQLRIASVLQPGILSELADRLASFRQMGRASMNRVAVVLPIRKRKREEVKRLLEQGPPFDPARVGLERHEVFLGDSEVVFLFEAEDESAVDRLFEETSALAAAAAWRSYVAGRPRLATPAFSWARPLEGDDLFFGPAPGPGDSEGGDVFAP